MASRPALKKQNTCSASVKPSNDIVEARASASIILFSPTNDILLLHRLPDSSSFASAHVFPGGNLSPSQDGEIPTPSDPARHRDGLVYRIGAIRECFEESGILLATKKDGNGMLQVSEDEREKARKEIQTGKLRFQDWIQSLGGIVDTGSLHPFTRWITPTNLPKRFTTQMYLYFLPLSANTLSSENLIPSPEHTAASFAPCSTWLHRSRTNSIILFPPQFYLLHLLSPFLSPSPLPLATTVTNQRINILNFVASDASAGNDIPWPEKVISPRVIFFNRKDGRSLLALDQPGMELEGTGRGGDERRVIFARFHKDAPRDLEVKVRSDVLNEERDLRAVEKL